MMYGTWNGDWGTMLVVMLLNGVVWIALIGLFIWALSRVLGQRSPSSGRPDTGLSALEILRQRYARGEIDEATFTRMQQQLEASSARNEVTSLPPR
jgi:putative membrane protein